MSHVLQLIGNFHQGGSERQAVQLTRLLAESGAYRMYVACLDGTGALRGEVERLSLGDIAEFPLTSFYDRNMFRQTRRFARYLREHRVDLVHTHDFYSNVFGMIGARLAGVSVRVASKRETAGVRSPAQARVERQAFRLAHGIIANAEAVKRYLVDDGIPAGKIEVVYNGLDLARLTPPAQLTPDEAGRMFGLPFDERSRIVTIVANMRSPVKDYPTFLRAARRVSEVVPDATFVLAGEGELANELRELSAQLNLSEKIHFTGRCERVAELLRLSDVCVLSSRAEGFSNAILEYMAASRPVVATDVGGAREAIIEGETGYLVDAGDDVTLAERIIKLLCEPELSRAMGNRGRKIVEEKFSVEAQLSRTQNMYDRLLGARVSQGVSEKFMSRKGQPDNSPAIHRWEYERKIEVVPSETTDASSSPSFQSSLTGLALDSCAIPGDESPGYCQSVPDGTFQRLFQRKDERDTPARDVSRKARGSLDDVPSPSETPPSSLRVLIIAASLDILGGQAVQAANLCERFGEESEIEVGFLPINPRLSGVLRRLQAVKYARTVVTSAFYIWLLLTRARKYDVLHIFSASYFSFVLAPTPAILIGKLYGKKVLLNYHSGEAEDHLCKWRRTALPTLRLCDMIAVPSAYLVEVFARFGLPARTVFNFIDTSRFRFRARRPLRPLFVSNRNLEKLYNVGCTLRAFALIRQRFPEARLTIAGDGSQRAALESLAGELKLENVEFVGRVAPERMPALYEASDIFLNASDIDNMPLSIIEAFAAGTPVVTTAAGGIPYLVADGKTGFVVKRNQPDALARAAIQLLEDEALSACLAANARAECERYAWEPVRDAWLKLYRELTMRPASMSSMSHVSVQTRGTHEIPKDGETPESHNPATFVNN